MYYHSLLVFIVVRGGMPQGMGVEPPDTYGEGGLEMDSLEMDIETDVTLG